MHQSVSLIIAFFLTGFIHTASAVTIEYTWTGDPMSDPSGAPFAIGDYITAVITVNDTDVGTTGNITPLSTVLTVQDAGDAVIFSLNNTTSTVLSNYINFGGLTTPQEWGIVFDENIIGPPGTGSGFGETITFFDVSVGTDRQDATINNPGPNIGYSNIGTTPGGSWDVTSVPEPSTVLPMACLAAAGLFRRRSKR